MRAGEAAIAEGPVPKHRQLREILLAMITTELSPGRPIPSERELGARFGVSRATVRAAVGQLVSDGHLERAQGKGTFVAAPRVRSELHLASFTADMRRRGLRPGTTVLRAEVVTAPAPVAGALSLQDDAPVHRVERLRTADGTPMAHELGWYPAARFPTLPEEDLAGSVYEVLDRLGARPDAGHQVMWAAACDEVRATLLAVEVGSPLFVFERTATAAGAPVEHVTSWFRADRYQVSATISSTP